MKQSKVLEYCTEIIKHLVENGYTNQVSKKELERIIKLFRGIDKRTVKTWMDALLEFEFIEYVNPCVVRLNLSKCPELLNLAIMEGQKKLI